jgi:hypothetical protein
MLALGAVAVAMAACERQGADRRPGDSRSDGGGSDEPLLLLDAGEEGSRPPTGPVADNSRCFVCHLNYAQESLAVVHAKANIGCADCHGASDAHIADESWSWGENGTAPDIMYPRPKINPFCMGCHPKDKIDAEQHKAFFAGTSEKKYCTDCHGNHRLAERKCKWK